MLAEASRVAASIDTSGRFPCSVLRNCMTENTAITTEEECSSLYVTELDICDLCSYTAVELLKNVFGIEYLYPALIASW